MYFPYGLVPIDNAVVLFVCNNNVAVLSPDVIKAVACDGDPAIAFIDDIYSSAL
jgi:hypothetical protein